jgi:hypothetical protein
MKSLKTTGVVAGRGGGQPEFSGKSFETQLLAIAAVILLTTLMTIGFAGPAAAVVGDEEFTIVIPIDTVVFALEGSTTVLAATPVAEEFAGQVCSVATRAENQESIHPGNDLIVESGSSLVTIEDVEGTAGGVVVGEGELELGSEIVISLVMGPDEVFSAGLDVVVDCTVVVEVTTTTLEATTTTLAATTTTNGQADSTSATLPSEQTTSTVDDTVRGTILTTTTVDDEVEDLVVLPFTGPSNGELLFLLGGAMALVGIILVGSRREDIE